MTDPLSFTSGYRRDLIRDLLALVLIVVGTAGLAWAAFATDWRLGVAVLSVAAGATGATLGLTRS